MKLIRSFLGEGITHIEDLPLEDFINAVQGLKDRRVTEKLDGSNLWFGLDDKGFFTSREGKSKRGKRFYSVDDYPLVANYNGFRGAHVALENHVATIKKYLKSGDMVEIEVLFGRQPNTVDYGHDNKNFIVILRGVETDQRKIDNLSKALQGDHSKVTSTIITSDDGEQLKKEKVTQEWSFTAVKPVDTKKVDLSAVNAKLVELQNYLKQPSKKLPGLTNKDVAELPLSKIPKNQRAEAKAEREAQLAFIMTNFKKPIKEMLLDTLVRKVKPFLQSKDVEGADDDIGVEGIVASDKKGNMVKIVDKDVWTAINTFNSQIRNSISGLVRTDDQDAPIELRGGAFGQAKIRIANLLGMKELAISSSARKVLTKFKGDTPEQTVQNLANSIQLTSFESTKTKAVAILKNSLEEIDGILESFKKNVGSYKMKVGKTGKEIGISPDVMKRTLTAFAETKQDINQIIKAVANSQDLPALLMALYGRTIQGLFSDGDSEVKESTKPTAGLTIGDKVTVNNPADGRHGEHGKITGFPVSHPDMFIVKFADGQTSWYKPKSLLTGHVQVKESIKSFNLLKMVEDADGDSATAGPDGDGDADDEATTASAIANYPTKMMNGRMVTRRPRKFIKKKKFALKTMEGKLVEAKAKPKLVKVGSEVIIYMNQGDYRQYATITKIENGKIFVVPAGGKRQVGFKPNEVYAEVSGGRFVPVALADMKVKESLIQIVEFAQDDQQFATDVDDKASNHGDVEFKQLRNQIKLGGDAVTTQDINDYLGKAHELNDEVDTVTFGLEMDDGSIAKVYVNADQADAFEKALSEKLGEEDDVEKVIDELSNTFDIVDVEWPDGHRESEETPVAADGETPEANPETGEDDTIQTTMDGEGEQEVDPVIDLSADRVGQGDDEGDGAESDSLMKGVNAQADKLGKATTPLDAADSSADGEGPDLGTLDNGDGEPDNKKTAKASKDEPSEPDSDVKDADTNAADTDTGEDDSSSDNDEDENSSSTDLTDLEEPDNGDDDGSGGGKKKKKIKGESDDDSSDTTTKESFMSFGQRFKDKLMAEAAKKTAQDDGEVVKKKKDEPAAEDAHAFSPQLKKLMTEFPNRGSKMMVALMSVLGVPLDAMVMKKMDLKKSVEAAGEAYLKDSQIRAWTKKLIDSIMDAQAVSVTEAGIDQELSSSTQRLVLAILERIGLPGSIAKLARASLRNGVKKVAALAVSDSKVRTNLKVVGEMLGVDAVTADMDDKPEVTEAKNHLGEPEQTTYAGWKRACKTALAKVDASIKPWLEGDEDIAELFIGEKPYKKGKTFSIGQWDGDKGSVYDVKDSVERLKKVAEDIGDPAIDATPEDWLGTVKQFAMQLGIPDWVFSYKANQIDMAIKKAAPKIKGRTSIQTKLKQMMQQMGPVVEEVKVVEGGEERAQEVITRIFNKLKELGVKKIDRATVDAWLCGGGALKRGFIDELEGLGYNSGASSYSENKDFWKKIGLSKFDYQNFVNLSA